jgi:hypothetical protein
MNDFRINYAQRNVLNEALSDFPDPQMERQGHMGAGWEVVKL